ncbi:MAG: DUF4347 domain-containing protein, partial [Burkholderiaceae bacterium]|nr:DUF4347 domain-containing protein [Burkholderiaceae bacterium]
MSKVKAISGKPKANEFKARPPMMFALEPRFMFDGAAIASVAHGHGGESDVHAFDFSALRSNLAELVTQGGARPVADHTARIGSATRQTDNTKTTVATTTATDTVSLPAGRDVVIIDSSVTDPQELVSLAPKGAEVYILNANSDGLTQISQILASGGTVAELQIISHGGDGYFLVGNDVVSADTLSYHSGVFQSWASHMAQGADIMLYGCNVAESAQGQAMMEQIASWTGTTAAASTHDVGAHGDWTLDFTTGAIAAQEFNGQSYRYDLATLEVTSLADAATEAAGNGTLRGEIEAAVAAGTDEVIVFDPSLFTSGAHTITLSGGVLDASDTKALTIIGPGASLLTIDGHYASQIFKSVGASGAPTGVLTLQGMTLERGQATSGAGGAVDALYSGGLTLDNMVVKDSKAIFNYGTSTGGYGGGGVGFSSYTSGAFTMNNSMIYGCTGSGPTGGGGLEASTYGSITISNSTIFNNTNALTTGAGAYGGGAKLGVSSGGSITLVNDTFAGNTGAYGAALLISNNGGTAVIRNSTFTTNVITAPSGSNESGAIEIQGGTVNLYNNIIAGNTLGSGAVGTAGLFIAVNSTAAGSHNASQETVAYSGVGGNGTNSLTSAISTTSINLGTLGFNGGPVETVALNSGSSAIGSGLTTGAPTTDARGDTRGAAIDLGAYAYSNLSTFSFDGSLFPANGYVDVPSTQNLVLDFGENVTAVSGKDIVIYNSNGTVFQTIAANDTSLVTIGAGTTADSEVTIAHNAFASDAGYYVEISSGAFVNAASLTFTGITNTSTWAFTSAVLPLPIVTAPNIHVTGDTGTGGDYKIGDVVTATWNDTAGGDNNSQTITGVTFNFSQFGGGTAVVATDVSNVWTATYTITAGSIDATNRNVAVTATDSTGNTTTTGANNVTVDDMKPAVTAGNISLSGASGTGGVFKIGDTVTATWNDGASGDNNTDTINAGGVKMNFAQFGGGTVTATDSSGVWTATYVVTAGAIDTSTAQVAVTVTDHAGNATTTSSSVASVDDIAPIVTSANISLSGGSGTSGAYKIGDIVTATWNDGVSGDNNTETINAGGVTMNFSQFGGGSVTATDSSGVWTATYTITAGAIDTNAAHVVVTATDAVGNATTTSSTAVTADNEQPVVTAGNISLSGATGAGGAFKVGDTVTATWNDGASGDNNTDTITAGGVTMNFAQFGGGTAVTATDSSGVWTATYVVTAGAIDT